MAYIIETPNALQPLIGVRKHIHPGGVTIRQWLQMQYPGFVEFPDPTICMWNGQVAMRKDWDKEIQPKDIVNFIGVVGYGLDIILVITLVVAVISIGLSLYLALTAPETPGEAPSSDPVFSTKGQSNAIRLGEPIECNYGRNRVYPSLASRPFFRYVNNDQFQFSLFCIGQGSYDIDTIQIGDTDINDFAEVQYEIIEPGDEMDLFRTNVFTSPEAGGQTLFAENEPEWVPPLGSIGPFPVCPSGEVVNKIEIDLSYPRGVYHQSKKDGDMENQTVRVKFQKRLIDNAGNPLGGFTTLFEDAFEAQTTTPQRRTISTSVTQGRYEVRGWNSGNISFQDPFFGEDGDSGLARLDNRSGYTVVWESMRGFIVGNEPDFGDVTLLAVKIKATNNLNARTQERFNVICTRKLPVLDSSGGINFTTLVPTRSIVWAFVDVFRANYGARITDERFFDLAALEELDAFYESRNEHFDWTFRDPVTVWDAAKTIARCGRAIPQISGSIITMKRDGPLEVPVTLFSPDNMIKGSFTWDIKLWEPNDHDSLSVEYTDRQTGFKQEQVLCVLPDSNATTDNPEDLRIPGIQNRNHAYREGLYILAQQRYLRENFSFETGLEGYIPSYGDLVAVSHDVPRWGQSGYIVAVEDESNGIFNLFVSEPLRFEESGQVYQILLRGKAGETIGPLDATETEDPKVVQVEIPEQSEDFDFLLGGTTEPMLFLFGVAGSEIKYGKIVKIEPQGGERIRLTVVAEEPIVHSFDELDAPDRDEPSIPPEIPDLPEISQLTLSQISSDLLIVQASWLAALGAQYYIVQSSTDGTNWKLEATTERTSLQFQTLPGLIHVRVAAVNNGQGPWIEEEIQMGLIAGLGIYNTWIDDLDWGIRWWPKVNADSWVIRVYDNTDPDFPVLKRTTTNTKDDLQFDYDYLLATTDSNLVREMLVKVDIVSLNDDTGDLEESGFPGELLLSNPIPAPAIHLGYEFIGEESGVDGFVYRLFWDNPPEVDLKKVKVYIAYEEMSVFDETMAQLVHQQTASSPGYLNVDQEAYVVIPMNSLGGHDAFFWWVVVFDIWGNEITSNVSETASVAELEAPTNTLLEDLISHWKLDEASGTRADSHGTNDLTDVNSVGSDVGIIDDAAVFIAADEKSLFHADNADLSMGDIDFTIAGWIWFDALLGTGLMGKWGPTALEYILYFDGSNFRFYVTNDGATPVSVTDPTSIVDAQWYFFCAWHDAGANTINISIDDGTPTSAAHSGGVFAGNADFFLGRDENGLSWADCRMDSVSIWKRKLTSAEITQLHNAGAGLDYPFA